MTLDKVLEEMEQTRSIYKGRLGKYEKSNSKDSGHMYDIYASLITELNGWIEKLQFIKVTNK